MTETFYEVMRRQGITRRSFLKFCSLTAAALGLGSSFAPRIAFGRPASSARRAVSCVDRLRLPRLASSGFGYAAVEAASGLLIHAVKLSDGLVARYRILRPTR